MDEIENSREGINNLKGEDKLITEDVRTIDGYIQKID